MTRRLDRTIALRAARQHGLISRAQARTLGATEAMIRQRLESGAWDKVFSGVYRLAGAPPSWLQSVTAACLATGPGSGAAHRTAGVLWRLPGITSVEAEVVVPRGRGPSPPGVVVHTSRSLARSDLTVIEGIPVTTPARTFIDLSAVVDAMTLEAALDDARRRDLIAIPRVLRRLDEIGGKGCTGSGVLRRLLEARAEEAPPESVLETMVLRLIRGSRLPLPVPQFEIRDGARVVARVDLAYPAQRVAIEADSRAWHSGRLQWERDLARRSALAARGWRVIHVTWARLRSDPAAIVAEIAAALEIDP